MDSVGGGRFRWIALVVVALYTMVALGEQCWSLLLQGDSIVGSGFHSGKW